MLRNNLGSPVNAFKVFSDETISIWTKIFLGLMGVMSWGWLILILVLGGCAKKPMDRIQTNNLEFKVDLLFEHDGCAVYRFRDNGYSRYFSDCRGQIQGSINCGKNCIRPDSTTNLGN